MTSNSNLKKYCQELNTVLSEYQSNIDIIKRNIDARYNNIDSKIFYSCVDLYESIRKYTITKEINYYKRLLDNQIQTLIDEYR